MKKYAFLVYHAQYNEFLSRVRDLGVLHVEEKQEGIAENDQLREKMMLSSKIEKFIQTAQKYIDPEQPLSPAAKHVEGEKLMGDFDNLLHQQELAEQELLSIQHEAERMKVWGNFSVEQIEKLNQAGIHLKCYSCPQHKFKTEWEEKYNAITIDTVNSTIYFVAFDAPFDIEADYISLNPKNYNELLGDIKSKQGELDSLHNDIIQWSKAHINDLKRYAESVQDLIDWQKVELNTDHAADDKIMLLEGYCPEEVEAGLNAAMDEMEIYYEISNPTIDEPIPIKLKNTAYSRLFEPITKLFSLPNYSELDLTPFLAPFYMLFFGLCLGDGGYGLLILVAATIVKYKIKPEARPFASLFQILGATTLVVGIITGAFFGIALDAVTWPWLANMKHLFVTEANYASKLDGYNPMMVFAIVIGLIQIFFGMGLNAAKITKQHGFKYAVSDVAWIVALLVSAAIFGLPLLHVVIPAAVTYIGYALIAISVLFMVFYNSPNSYKKPVLGLFGNVGGVLWRTYNTATGLLGDTLSYIRLFALGLTGSILGGVFNSLALDLTQGLPIVINWIVMLLILLFGHSINFGLCLIGAFVHPLRLTFVEFYKNAGFEGGGKSYAPFHQRNKA